MSNFKKILSFGLAAVLILSLACCKDDDNPTSSNGNLEGTWKLSKIEVTVSGITMDVTNQVDYNATVVLKSDKTYTMTIVASGETTTDSGTYSAKDGSITFTPTVGSTMVWTYTVNGSTLVAKTTLDLSSYSLSTETPVSFTFNKQ
jgi:hypothetical protein